MSDRIDLGQLAHILRERARFILACAALSLAAVVVVTMASHMRFKARGSLYLGELQANSAQAPQPDQFDFLGGRSGDVGTEMEILKSRDLIKRAILESGLNVRLSPAGWRAPRYWRWRLGRRDLELLDVGSRALVPRNVALSKNTNVARTFTVTVLKDGKYALAQDGQPLGSAAFGVELSTPRVKLTLAPGREGPPAEGAQYEMSVTPLDQVADSVEALLTVATPKGALPNEAVKVVNLDFIDQSPRAAAAFVSDLMDSYLERRQSWKSEEATAAEVFVTGQVKSVKDSLDAAEQQLADYKRGSTVVMLGDEAKQMIDQLARYEEQRMAARLQLTAFNQVDTLLKKNETAPIEQYLVGEGSDQVLAGLSSSLAQAQQELTRMESRFTDDAPALREQRTQVETQLKMVKNYIAGRRARAQGQLDSLNEMIGKFEDKLKTVPHAEQALVQLTRHTEVLSKIYSFLLERQQQVAVVKAATVSKNHILDVPEVPYREDSPALGIRLVAGLLIGLLIGVALVISRRLLAMTFQTEKELRRELGEIPLYGAVPERKSLPVSADGPLPFDVFATDPHSAFAEAFRYLRANLYYSGAAKDDKVILITSPNQADGKTLCALSLASALVADGKRVLVIEADMHRPSHHALFQQPLERGLSEVLTRQATWAETVRTIGTSGGEFDAVTAGPPPPSPTELLSSPQFGALVAHAKKDYDFVLIDSPPFPLVSDALVMSIHADRVLTVLRLRNSRRRAAEEHVRRLFGTVSRYGVVINGLDGGAHDGAYGYGHPYRSDARKTSGREWLAIKRAGKRSVGA